MTDATNETLVYEYQNGDEERRKQCLEALYNQNLGMIRKLAKQYSMYEDEEDLTQEAYCGMITAAERYDPEKDSLFLTYATLWMKQSINKYLESCGHAVRVPAYIRQTIIKYMRLMDRYRKEHGTDPDDNTVMTELNLTGEQLKKLRVYTALRSVSSLDKPLTDGDDAYTLADVTADPADHYEDINGQLDGDILKRVLWSEVSALDDSRAEILRKRFQGNLTLKQIGDELGINIEAVKRLQSKAFNQLRKSEKLRAYREEYLLRAYKGTGLRSFRNRGSSTERIAISLCEKAFPERLNELQKSLDEVNAQLEQYRQIGII